MPNKTYQYMNLLNIYAFLILNALKKKFSDGYMAESDTEF